VPQLAQPFDVHRSEPVVEQAIVTTYGLDLQATFAPFAKTL
jgi:hypothetical protein